MKQLYYKLVIIPDINLSTGFLLHWDVVMLHNHMWRQDVVFAVAINAQRHVFYMMDNKQAIFHRCPSLCIILITSHKVFFLWLFLLEFQVRGCSILKMLIINPLCQQSPLADLFQDRRDQTSLVRISSNFSLSRIYNFIRINLFEGRELCITFSFTKY